MGTYVDVEALLVDWLKTAGGYVNVATEVPTNLVDLIRTNPVIVLERIGGADATITIDTARVDLDVYANSRDGAKLHAEKIRAAMRVQLIKYVHGGAVVGRVDTLSAPARRLYDSRNIVRRFGASYQLTLHQFSGIG